MKEAQFDKRLPGLMARVSASGLCCRAHAFKTLRIVPLLLPILLAGCFFSNKSLYRGVTPEQPFSDGTVLTSTDGDKVERTVLHEVSPGIYRVSNEKIVKNQEDYRFFALPGAPAAMLVVESRGVQAYCGGRQRTCPPMYVYGLWHLTPGGLENFNPDCSKIKGVAALPGVKKSAKFASGGSGSDCEFTSRASLEQAFRMMIAAHLKPDGVVARPQ